MRSPDARRVYRRWGRLPDAYELAVGVYLLGDAVGWRRRTIAALGLDRGDRVLDLACGTGVNLELLEERVGPEGSIVALDQSTEMLARASTIADEFGGADVERFRGGALYIAVATA